MIDEQIETSTAIYIQYNQYFFFYQYNTIPIFISSTNTILYIICEKYIIFNIYFFFVLKNSQLPKRENNTKEW